MTDFNLLTLDESFHIVAHHWESVFPMPKLGKFEEALRMMLTTVEKMRDQAPWRIIQMGVDHPALPYTLASRGNAVDIINSYRDDIWNRVLRSEWWTNKSGCRYHLMHANRKGIHDMANLNLSPADLLLLSNSALCRWQHRPDKVLARMVSQLLKPSGIVLGVQADTSRVNTRYQYQSWREVPDLDSTGDSQVSIGKTAKVHNLAPLGIGEFFAILNDCMESVSVVRHSDWLFAFAEGPRTNCQESSGGRKQR